jgi:hypothetical protein
MKARWMGFPGLMGMPTRLGGRKTRLGGRKTRLGGD